jgi:hypothetical protein
MSDCKLFATYCARSLHTSLSAGMLRVASGDCEAVKVTANYFLPNAEAANSPPLVSQFLFCDHSFFDCHEQGKRSLVRLAAKWIEIQSSSRRAS